MSCAGGRIEGMSCGDNPTERLIAPEGFKYRWYLPDNPERVLSDKREFPLAPDDYRLFNCDVIQPTNPDCWFTLQASAVPRWPQPLAYTTIETVNCVNRVTFHNESCVLLVNPLTHDTVVASDETCETYLWDFGDGTTSTEASPIHEYPCDGKTYTATLTATMGNGKCLEVMPIKVKLPDIMNRENVIDDYVCQGSKYNFHDRELTEAGEYRDTTIDATTGCMNIDVLNLELRQPVEVEVYDTTCSELLPYIFNGNECNATDDYSAVLEGSNGCDSVVTLHLKVNESMLLDIPDVVEVCSDAESLLIPYSVISGDVSTMTVSSESLEVLNQAGITVTPGDAAQVGFEQGVMPGRYSADLVFHNSICGDYTKKVEVSVLYPDSVISQRWSDVLAIKNATSNGGFSFTTCKWYKDGVAIPGADGFNLYLPDGLDLNSRYQAKLVRTDGVEAFTCGPELIDYGTEGTEPIVTFSNGVSVQSVQSCSVGVYTVSGVLLQTIMLEAGQEWTARLAPGVYVLRFTTHEGSSLRKIVINN